MLLGHPARAYLGGQSSKAPAQGILSIYFFSFLHRKRKLCQMGRGGDSVSFPGYRSPQGDHSLGPLCIQSKNHCHGHVITVTIHALPTRSLRSCVQVSWAVGEWTQSRCAPVTLPSFLELLILHPPQDICTGSSLPSMWSDPPSPPR